MIQRGRNFLVCRTVPLVAKDQKEGTYSFAFTQGKFPDALVKNRIGQMKLIVFSDPVHKGFKALINLFFCGLNHGALW